MKTQSSRRKAGVGKWIGAAAVAAMFALPALAYADDPVTMAPPVQADAGQGAPDVDQGAPDVDQTADTPDNASQDSVFEWNEVPANQRVPLTRAAFDEGGYQLYDTVGETIVVPFTDNNLYVMKFGLSDDGTAYFVNDGSEPVLYLPQDGYLENATVPGAKWYPFPQDYQPTAPVFLGVAPSWDAYVNMGWYPDMVSYGGYYCNGPFFAGIHLFPTIGLTFVIGGHDFHDWDAYQTYYHGHAAPFHVGFHDRQVYHWADHSFAGQRTFGGVHVNINVGGRNDHGGGGQGPGRTRQFHGAGGGSDSAPSGGHPYSSPSGHAFNSGSQTSGGSTGPGRSSGGHTFRGGHASSGHARGDNGQSGKKSDDHSSDNGGDHH